MIEALKTNFDFFALLWVFGLHEDGDLVVFATDNAEVSGTQMHIDLAAGGKRHLERVTRQVGDFDLFGLGENKRGEENRKGEKADGVRHGHTPSAATQETKFRGEMFPVFGKLPRNHPKERLSAVATSKWRTRRS